MLCAICSNFLQYFKNEKDINGAFMLCYVESKFYTVTVVAFFTVFQPNLPYIQLLLASCALHYDVDWMYDLQG